MRTMRVRLIRVINMVRAEHDMLGPEKAQAGVRVVQTADVCRSGCIISQ